MMGSGIKEHPRITTNKGHHRIFPILFITFILVSIFFNGASISGHSKQKDTFSTSSAAQGATRGDAIIEEDDWVLVNEFEETIEINKGSDLFIKASPRAAVAQKFEIKKQLDHSEFLSTTAQTALEQVPAWLRDDLAEKFIDLAQIELYLSSESSAGFSDLDADGDFDMVCTTYYSDLIYFENCGTNYEPMYLRDDTVFEEINKLELGPLSEPTLGDIDLDNDLDIVLGSENGEFFVLENNGDANSPQFNEYISHLYPPIPGYTSPYLVDLNEDGHLDIVTGAEDGRIYYLYAEQNGTIWSLRFTSPFDNIDVGDRSKPTLLDLDNDGDLDLTVGEAENNLNYYRNIGTNANPNWLLDTTMYLGLPVNTLTSPELVDINGDRRPDLVVGDSNGVFNYFENIGTASDPQWQVWSTYSVWPGIAYYDTTLFIKCINYSSVNEYAQMIIDAESNLKDEIAFSIAHTATRELIYSYSRSIYKDNAELLYKIDNELDYATIKDYGSYEDRDYYSTIEYKYKASSSSTIQTTEIPRDIYYWYVVHPKITDESPMYIDPATGEEAAAPTGRFWREYLFNHNDQSYPPDPPTDINDDGIPDYHYPKETSPPLLKEKLSGISYLYDFEPYNSPQGYKNDGYNNSRPWGYKDHAIEAVSNWVAKTLPLNEQESADGERPIQPVRISRHHNGNCGELQDLSVAAARTALIPAAGVMLWAEDHVWNEFYINGWHQWDNYWSDGGSVVDNFMNYWVGWGQRGGSGISKWHGDDSTSDAIERYVPAKDLSTLTIHVNDRNGNPVDGARVMVGSYWTTVEASGSQVSIPFPSIWNYTDNDGICTFKVATQQNKADGNKNFSFKIISKLGNADQGKTEIEHAQDYDFWFTLDGRAPETDVNVQDLEVPPSYDRFKFELSYEVLSGSQYPPNPWVFNSHPQTITTGLGVTSFICDEDNFNFYSQAGYRTGSAVDAYHLVNDALNDNITFELPDNDDWYFVIYNKNSIETYKHVKIIARIYEIPDEAPKINILEPKNNQTFYIGDEVPVEIFYSDDYGLVTIFFAYDDYELHGDANSYMNMTLIDDWNTTGETEGIHTISGKAEDTKGNFGYSEISIILEERPLPPPPPPPPPQDITPPEIVIENPQNGTLFTVGSEVSFEGSAWDDFNLTTLTLTINSKKVDLLPLHKGFWTYIWDSKDQSAGEYKFNIRGTDEAGNVGRAFGNFELIEEYIDRIPPDVTIDKPELDETLDHGSQVWIKGTIQDDIGVKTLEISVVYQEWIDITESIIGNNWMYQWDTSTAKIGDQIIMVRAFDHAGNFVEDSRIITLLDVTPPEISILAPEISARFDWGMDVEIEGLVEDDVGLDKIIIIISGPGGTEKIKKGIERNEDEWSYTWEVPFDYTNGDYILTVTVNDFAGNSDSDSTTINIYHKTESEKESGFFSLPGFELGILILIILCAVYNYKNHSIIYRNKKQK